MVGTEEQAQQQLLDQLQQAAVELPAMDTTLGLAGAGK